MRVLQIDRQRHWAGQQVRTFGLAERLRENGVEVFFACAPESGYEKRATKAGFPVTAIGMRAASIVTAVPKLVRLLRRERIDIVDAHGSVDHNLSLVAAGIARRPVVVRTKHNHTHLHNFMSHMIYRRMTRRIIAISGFVRKILLEDGVDPARVDLIPSSIDTARIIAAVDGADRSAARARFGVPEGAFVIGTTSRPSPRKGIDVAVAAVAALRRERPHARVVYVIGGGSAESMRRFAERGGLEAAAVVAPGFISPVTDLFPALDAFLLPSHEEALGVALLEAMAAGLPVVASAVGGVPEVVLDGETGLLVPPGDPAAIARAVGRYLDDPALARRAGQAARARIVERHDVRTMAERTRVCYDKALGGA